MKVNYICSCCGWQGSIRGNYRQLNDTRCDYCGEAIAINNQEVNEYPLLTIEVKDIHSLPIVKYNGEEIRNRIAVEYQWGTRGEGPGKHALYIEHATDDKLTIRKIGLEEIR